MLGGFKIRHASFDVEVCLRVTQVYNNLPGSFCRKCRKCAVEGLKKTRKQRREGRSDRQNMVVGDVCDGDLLRRRRQNAGKYGHQRAYDPQLSSSYSESRYCIVNSVC